MTAGSETLKGSAQVVHSSPKMLPIATFKKLGLTQFTALKGAIVIAVIQHQQNCKFIWNQLI